jgi:hypothetical protein
MLILLDFFYIYPNTILQTLIFQCHTCIWSMNCLDNMMKNIVAKLSPKSELAQPKRWVSLNITVSRPTRPANPASHPSEYQNSYNRLVQQQVSSKWKTTSPFLVNGRRPHFFLKMKKDRKKFANGRLPQKICKWKTTSKNLQMEDDLKQFANGRRPQL